MLGQGLTGFSSFVAFASGVSDGIQKLGSALSLSLPAGPALDPGWASSAVGRAWDAAPTEAPVGPPAHLQAHLSLSPGPFPAEATLGMKGLRGRLTMAASFSRKPRTWSCAAARCSAFCSSRRAPRCFS